MENTTKGTKEMLNLFVSIAGIVVTIISIIVTIINFLTINQGEPLFHGSTFSIVYDSIHLRERQQEESIQREKVAEKRRWDC